MRVNSKDIEAFNKKHLKVQPEQIQSLAINPLTKLWLSWCVESQLTNGECQNLLTRYIGDTYKGTVAYNKSTNLPRMFWEREDISWSTFLEAIKSMDPKTAYLGIEVKSPKGIFRMVQIDLLKVPPKSKNPVSLKTSKDRDELAVYAPDIYKEVKGWEAYLLRKILYEYNVTWGYIEDQLTKYVNDSGHMSKYTKPTPASVKGNLKGELKKYSISWDKFLEILLALGFVDYDLTLLLDRNKGTHKTKVMVSWRW